MSRQPAVFADQLSIDTPELVAIRFPLAGVGSRLVALFLDYSIQGGALLAALLLLTLAPAGKLPAANLVGNWAIAIFLLALFLLHWGYFTLFEAFWHGQTLGKRALRLRAIHQSGRPLSFFESMERNLLRIIDALPAFYLAGALAVFLSRRHQRLGDMVAGSVVVHERRVEAPMAIAGNLLFPASSELSVAGGPVQCLVPADLLTRLSLADLEAIDAFLDRRLDLPLEARGSLAERMASAMAAKMQFAIPCDVSLETFLEGLASGLRNTAIADHPAPGSSS